MKFYWLIYLSLLSASQFSEHKVDSFTISERLLPFKIFVGNTYLGKIENSKIKKAQSEKCTWEWALNGSAVRMLRSINGNEYQTETIIMWNPNLKRLVGWSFSSSGNFVKKFIEIKKKKIIITEDVSDNSNGITTIRTSYISGYDGFMSRVTQYLMKGIWVDGNEIKYQKIKTKK